MAFMNPFSRLSNFHFIFKRTLQRQKSRFGHLFFTEFGIKKLVFEESRCPKLKGIRKETFGNSSEDKTRNDTKNWDFCLLWLQCVKLSYQSSGSLKFHTFLPLYMLSRLCTEKLLLSRLYSRIFFFLLFLLSHTF